MTPITCALREISRLGESPVWSGAENALYFVDIHRPSVHRFDPVTGALQTWPMPENVGSIGLRAGGGLVASMRRHFVEIDLPDGGVRPLQAALFDADDLRFNDGRCDRRGRFWAGTVQEKRREGLAALYRLEPGGACRSVADGLTVSNGIAWSPDDRVMYLADSWTRTIYAFDFDLDAGEIANRRVFARFAEDEGIPDGATVDADGCYWIAHFDGGRISRYTPRGERDRVVPMPVPRPTSCAFGGPDLRTLYVTSASFGLQPDRIAAAPLSGCLFALDVGAQGLPEAQFGRPA